MSQAGAQAVGPAGPLPEPESRSGATRCFFRLARANID